MAAEVTFGLSYNYKIDKPGKPHDLGCQPMRRNGNRINGDGLVLWQTNSVHGSMVLVAECKEK